MKVLWFLLIIIRFAMFDSENISGNKRNKVKSEKKVNIHTAGTLLISDEYPKISKGKNKRLWFQKKPIDDILYGNSKSEMDKLKGWYCHIRYGIDAADMEENDINFLKRESCENEVNQRLKGMSQRCDKTVFFKDKTMTLRAQDRTETRLSFKEHVSRRHIQGQDMKFKTKMRLRNQNL
ncbi:hypothetical protein HELRODRAFT_177344 [Helobdella robusta]|uniref:Uncharacterized protein n=1 Tax=Helobdella robusta TaxID=6412 RepID=T1FBJ3_HELRO|nr:hypothetical protein HELRODRAFT_177344 [Helobdella robusta]ESN98106.1 hypothetical protein HELRODRAFT_177344 [Helobdella robusta]